MLKFTCTFIPVTLENKQMRKSEVRTTLSRPIIAKLDQLREIYDGAPRSVVVAIAIRRLFEQEQAKAAPSLHSEKEAA